MPDVMFFMLEYFNISYKEACEMPALTILRYIRWHVKYNIIINVVRGLAKQDTKRNSNLKNENQITLFNNIPHPSTWIKKRKKSDSNE
jgi:hypothetical protein